MNEEQIYGALTQVFHEVFDDETIVLSPTTNTNDIEDWDSQAHVTLIVASEERFGIRFRTAELESLHNVGQFVRLIHAKLQ